MSLAPGARIGAFEVLAPLGKGGMGEVFRARDTRLQRDVALKVLPDLFASDPDRLARFKNEAQLLASLSHPNIAAVYGFEEFPSTQSGQAVRALVLELVEGPTLADRIARGPVPLEEALSIARQIAEALEAAHDHNIIHRDLKPSNVKLRSDGTVKVLDFGLAKALSPEAGGADDSLAPTITSPAITAAGIILGTAAYMAPEQAIGKAADKRSDIWSFGVVLYEMLTGSCPFAAATTIEVLSQVLRSEPDWTALPATVPVAIRSVLKRCLQRDRARRLHDIADARFQIEDAIRAPADLGTAPPPVLRRRHRERVAWVAALVAVATVAALASQYLGPHVQAEEIHLEINAPPTTSPSSIAVSPDGRSVVYAAISEGKERLWVRSLNDGSTRMLPTTDAARYPFWSPDSRSIGFFADGLLKRIDVQSAAVQTLADGSLGGAWNRDDTILFTPAPSTSVSRIPASGGQPTPLMAVNAQIANQRFPQLLPDGRHFLYYATGTAPGIYLGQLDSHDTRRLLEADAATYTNSGYLLFVRQGTLFAQPFDRDRLQLTGRAITVEQQVVSEVGVAAVSAVGNTVVYRAGKVEAERQLVWFDRSGKELERVRGSNWAGGSTVSLSPDGRTVAFE